MRAEAFRVAVLAVIGWGLVLVLFAGCTSTGAADPDLGNRLAADVNCFAQASFDGLQVYGAKGVPSANDTYTAILNASTLTQELLDKCGPMLKNLGANMSAVKAKVAAGKAKPKS